MDSGALVRVGRTMNVAQLVSCGIHPTQAKVFALPLREFCSRFDIVTPARQAAFIAQCGHESLNFTRLEESLYYRTPERIREMWPTRVPSLADATKLCKNPQALANTVYSNRLGNGGFSSNDGWNYRGRGLIQLTGRANYRDAGQALGQDYVRYPSLVANPADAVLVAAWFWHTNKLNILADASNIDAITRVVNGPAMAGKIDRRQRFEEALDAFR